MRETATPWRRRLDLDVEGAAQVELAELHEAARRLPGLRALRFGLIGGVALLALNVVYTHQGTASLSVWTTLLVAACCAVTAFAWWAPRAAARKVWQKLGEQQSTLRVRLNDDGITFAAGAEVSSFEWQAVRRYAETSTSFLIFIDRYVAQVLPKRAFSEKDLPVVRRFLRRYSSEGAQHVLPRPLLVSLALLVTAFVVWQALWSPKGRTPAPASAGIVIQLAPASPK